MSVSVNFYQPGESWLHRTDPRVKLLLVGISLFLLILYKNLWFMTAALALMHLLHWSAKTPWTRIRWIWKVLLPVGLLMLILRMAFYPAGEALFSIWLLHVTNIGLAEGVTLALRIFTMALAVFAWLYTTSQADLVQSLVRLGMPHAWGLVLALALRYIPTFQGTYMLISEAQQARGLNMRQYSGFKRVKVMMPIFVAMIISSLRASGQMALALEARGYGQQGVPRSTLTSLRMRKLDYALTAALLLALITLTFLYFRYGFGAAPLGGLVY